MHSVISLEPNKPIVRQGSRDDKTFDSGQKIVRKRRDGVCFGLTADSAQAKRAELAIMLNVAAAMHRFRCNHNI